MEANTFSSTAEGESLCRAAAKEAGSVGDGSELNSGDLGSQLAARRSMTSLSITVYILGISVSARALISSKYRSMTRVALVLSSLLPMVMKSTERVSMLSKKAPESPESPKSGLEVLISAMSLVRHWCMIFSVSILFR